MGVSDRIKIAKMAADKSRRAALSRILYSRPLRWRYGSAAVEQLVIVPQDLRTADPSFWHEIELGQFGLAGTGVVLNGRSPFEVVPPNHAWARSLHGFGWLAHLNASGNSEARVMARRLAVEWITRQRVETRIAWEPAVIGRRLISWLSHASLLLDDAEPRTYEAITQSLGSQLVRLSATWRDGPDGYPRLLALIALMLADLSIAGHDRRLKDAEQAFEKELSRQILGDGGHISRNTALLVEIMLDILPLRQCFLARDRRPPDVVLSSMRKMLGMLRFMRMGDGMLARFNGVSVARAAGLATVLAYDDHHDGLSGVAPRSRYARLESGDTIVVMDVGGPPPLVASGEAHAGCLSFEMSTGANLVFVNGGAPAPADHAWRAIARATASHNTLCLAESSSSVLVMDKRLEQLLGMPALRQPGAVGVQSAGSDGESEVSAWHDGYRERTGLIHQRRIVVERSGRVLGFDRLDGHRVKVRLRKDMPFSLHFHLHPDVKCSAGAAANTFDIRLKDGTRWRFCIQDAVATLEESIHFADSAGPVGSLQIVARGATFGETALSWVIEPAT